MTSFYKIVRRHPVTGDLVDTYTGSLVYKLGELTVDPREHGLSIHSTPTRAVAHTVPEKSVGCSWRAVLVRVGIEACDIIKIKEGDSAEKTLVRRLLVEAIERDDIHPDIAQRGLSAYRMADAERWLKQGWGGFRVVEEITRRAPKPETILRASIDHYCIECRPATTGGRYARSVSYRAVPLRHVP